MELFNYVFKEFDDNEHILKALRRLYIRACSERDYSAQEVCHLLSNRHLFSAGGRKFVIINFNKDSNWTFVSRDSKKKKNLSIFEKYASRPQLEIFNDITLYQMVTNYDSCWHRKTKPNIVRIFPKIRIGQNAETNHQYYRQQVLLHFPWRNEEEFSRNNESWETIFRNKQLESHTQINVQVERDVDESDAESECEEAPHLEEFMVVSQLCSNKSVTEVELGLRQVDCNHDWTYAKTKYEQYGSALELQSFIKIQKQREKHMSHIETQQTNNNIKFSTEQQAVINLLHQQIQYIHSSKTESKNPMNTTNFVKLTIIQGKAGTGKTLLLQYMASTIQHELGQHAIMLLGPTGVAAKNIGGSTLHSGLHIPTNFKDFKPLSGNVAKEFCDMMSLVLFLIIDEYSMIGCSMLRFIDLRCKQGKGNLDPFGGLFIYLMGDIKQLPPVKDMPLYSATARDHGNQGLMLIKSFERAFFLKTCFRQKNQHFQNILDSISSGSTTECDYQDLSQRFILNANNAHEFQEAMRLFAKCYQVEQFNKDKMKSLINFETGNHIPIARIEAKHNNTRAKLAPPDKAYGLHQILYLAPSAKIMLLHNLWTEKGLVNGALGTIIDIIYEDDKPPYGFPKIVICSFPTFSGQGIGPENFVPIAPACKSFEFNGTDCSREQFPLMLSYACSIYKSQGITLEKAVINIGDKEFALGLSYVGLSRVRELSGLLLEPFDFDRISRFRKFAAMQQRIQFETFLSTLVS